MIKNFRKSLLGTATLQEALASRGFILDSDSGDDNYCLFTKDFSSETVFGLLFSIRKPDSCSIDMFLMSRGVAKLYHDLGLFINKPLRPEGGAKTVLSVNLLWLRLNFQPEMLDKYKFDYSYREDCGVIRIVEDIDSVGQQFLYNLTSVSALADFLANLDEYEFRTSYGGRPISVDPYIFSSLLYIIDRDYRMASKVLIKGADVYNIGMPLRWQEIRLRNFQARARKIMEYIEELNNARGKYEL